MSRYSNQFKMYAAAVKNELEMAYKQGRADAIDEVYVMALNESHDTLIEWLQEQLKENKE